MLVCSTCKKEAADRFSPTELVQPGTCRATSATQSCVHFKASALARAAASTSARETTLQHTATVPKTNAGINLAVPPFFAPFCANCCVFWLPLLSAF